MPPSVQPRNAQVQSGSRHSAQRSAASARSRSPHRDAPRARPSRAPARSARSRTKTGRVRNFFLIVALLILALAVLIWFWVDSRLTHIDALSGAADTPGHTYLIVGSDARDGWGSDGTEGARTDTIMVLHQPEQGPTALISIPRDSYVEIPGRSSNKINASYAFGGAPLLVETVENLTGLTVDHVLEVGFLGVVDVVDALGGVELCHDTTVDDWRSDLQWEAGCHVADGDTALAFSRMRYSDPTGDIGRTERQQQLISAVAQEAFTPATVLNPATFYALGEAGLSSIRVSEDMNAFRLAQFAMAFNAARSEDAVTGTPPLVSLDHRVDGVGSTVLLDAERNERFWRRIANGEFEPGAVVGGPP